MQDAELSDVGHQPPGARRWARALLAIAVAGLIFLVATLAASALLSALAPLLGAGEEGVRAPGEIEGNQTLRFGIFLIAMQAITVLLTVLATRLFTQEPSRLLPMRWPKSGLKGILLSVFFVLALAIAGGSLVYAFDKSAFTSDMKPFADMAQTGSWWVLLLAAAIGAPIAEECLFRGFLFGNLRATGAGFPGAALATAILWSALHANYSLYGVAMIVSIGLYFAYLREKSQSLIPSLVCHAVYNGLIVLALASSPGNAVAGP